MHAILKIKCVVLLFALRCVVGMKTNVTGYNNNNKNYNLNFDFNTHFLFFFFVQTNQVAL